MITKYIVSLLGTIFNLKAYNMSSTSFAVNACIIIMCQKLLNYQSIKIKQAKNSGAGVIYLTISVDLLDAFHVLQRHG